MKKFGLLTCCFFSLVYLAKGQITITYNDYPSIGDTEISVNQTSGFSNITVGDTGINKSWNFTGIQNDFLDTVIFFNPASTPKGSSFPNAEIAGYQISGDIYFYLDSLSGKTEVLGVAGDLIGDGNTVVLPFNPTETQMLIPSTYLTAFQDTYAYHLIFDGSSFGLDSIEVWSRTFKNSTIDGWGTVKTPMGIFDCLRNKVKEVRYDTSYIKFMDTWVPGNADSSISYRYTWLTNGDNSTLAEIETDELGDIIQAQYTLFPTIPTADFNANDEVPLVDTTVNFYDLSLGTPNSWIWDFGDTSAKDTNQNPSHSYKNTGYYDVTLIATNSLGSDTMTKTTYIHVILSDTIPAANYTFTNNMLAVQFTDSSTFNPNTWNWNFDDGTSSTLVNPSHTFTNTGTYNVCLTVTNTAGSDTICKDVILFFPPEADFGNYADSLTVYFSDLTIYDPVSWDWDFGDGISDTTQNAIHTYQDTGTYTVCLIAGNSLGQNTVCKVLNVYLPPVADFTFAINDKTITFTDQSSNSPDLWTWDFGDSPIPGFTQNPVHIYAAYGTYNVCLDVSNAYGSDQICKDVNVYVLPAADFTYTVDSLTVTFKDSSVNNPVAWKWTFGDGSSSTTKNPFNTYDSAGTYTVCLTATNPAGSDTICKNILLSGTGINELFSDLGKIILYPNPSDGKLYILLAPYFREKAKIEVLNLLGETVLNLGETNSSLTEVDLTNYEKGIYFVRIQTNSSIQTLKVLLTE